MKISIVLAALTGSFETDMNRASKTAQKRIKEIEKTAKEVAKVVGTAVLAVATASAVAIKAAIDRADELSKTAQKIGITTEALSALSYAADLADVELNELQSGLGRLTKFQSEAAKGTEQNIALFQALGIEFRNVDGTLRNTEEVFRDFADVFAVLPDGASKTALALDVFGRSGANLIPLLDEGAAGLEAMRKEAEELGLIVSTETGKAAEQFNDNVDRLKKSVGALATAVAADLLPDLVALTDEFVDNVKAGGGVESTAHDIADAFRSTAEFGVKVFNVIKAITLGAVGFYAKVGEMQQKFTAARFLPGAADAAQSFADLSAVSFEGAAEALNRVSFGPESEAPESGGSSGSPNGRGRGVAVDIGKTTDALNEYYASRERATEADKAAAEAARLAAEAERERQRILDAGIEASANLSTTIEQNAADLAGPAAQAARAYADEMTRLLGEQDKLAAANLLTADTERELAIAREQSFESYQRQLDDIEKQRTEVYDGLMADLAFELELIGKSNLEREIAIAQRYAQADAASAEGQAIADAIVRIDEAARNAEGVEFFKSELKSVFVDLTDGVGSASDAIDDFFDNLKIRALEALADGLVEKLFSSFGGGGGASSTGGGFMDFIGSLFGGARANGGPMSPGKAYLVGEEGPEVVFPSAAGTVIPAAQTASMLRGGRGGDTITILGSTSKRSLDRLAIERGRNQRKQTARTG